MNKDASNLLSTAFQLHALLVE